MALVQSPPAQILSHFFFLCWRPFPLTEEADFRTAWVVCQGGFSDVFETIIVSHFLCLHCLLQVPNAEIPCSVWMEETGHVKKYYSMSQIAKIASALKKVTCRLKFIIILEGNHLQSCKSDKGL